MLLEKGKKYKVSKRLLCKHSEHEVKNYPREGVELKYLEEGDVVTYKGDFVNFYGIYDLFIKDGSSYEYNIDIDDSMDNIVRLDFIK